jgi:transcriptional regulator with XRE-family HTH domain
MTDPDTPERRSLGREIRRLRLASGITLPELSGLSGIREAYLAAIEDDREEPSAPALERIALHLAPAGGSFELLARLLTQAEFNAAGEYPKKTQASELGASVAEDVWRRKTDVEVLDAARYIDQFTDEGRRAILKEVERRAPRAQGPGLPLAPEALNTDLQFDRAEFAGAAARTPCAICYMPLGDSYFQVNGGAMCTACCDQLRKSLNAGSPISRAAWATGAGLLAAAAGTILCTTRSWRALAMS